MLATIKNIEKRQIDGALHVVTTVEFVTNAGVLAHTQEYVSTPEALDPAYFQRQADCMQTDLDQAAQQKIVLDAAALEEAKADAAIARMKHTLQLGDEVRIDDRKG